jgi:hypothetical protein
MLASSRATRLAITHFSLQVLTNRRYFWRLSKKRKFRCGDARRDSGAQSAGALDDSETRGRLAMPRDIGAHPLEGFGGDAAAVAQARRELAVIDRKPAEGRFGKPNLPAVDQDLLEEIMGARGR